MLKHFFQKVKYKDDDDDDDRDRDRDRNRDRDKGGSRGSVVGIMTRLWAGSQTNHIWTTGSINRFSLL